MSAITWKLIVACLGRIFALIASARVTYSFPIQPFPSALQPECHQKRLFQQSSFSIICATRSSSNLDSGVQDKASSQLRNATQAPPPRPFHQHWWPVTTIRALSRDKPNAAQVLGLPLVVYWNKLENNWVVLDDRCSHRFAPLSEGRVLPDSGCLQCAYHGWEFDARGSCTRVPQVADGRKGRPVRAYPAQERACMLWVWTDPDTSRTLGIEATIPVSPILDQFVDYYGQDSCFMRDLPYGMEILGENLLDVSHLPFAHHGTGALRRQLGGELPMRMLSDNEKKLANIWETDFGKNESDILVPLMQAEIVNAGANDPILKGYQTYAKAIPDETWKVTAAFYEPNHIRYRRLRGGRAPAQQEIFLCPLAPGKSRVFLFNARSSIAVPQRNSTKAPQSFFQRIRVPKLFEAKTLIRSMIVQYLFDPRRAASHMVYNDIFDGDGIFLSKQGQRMEQYGLTYRNYSTPASCDILLNGFRRYLDTASQITKGLGFTDIAKAVTSDSGSYRPYSAFSREEFLDRYRTHTQHCQVCSKAYQNSQRMIGLLSAARTAALGFAGALTGVVVWALRYASASTVNRVGLGGAAAAAWLLAYMISFARSIAGKQKDKFVFVDYVHAEKD